MVLVHSGTTQWVVLLPSTTTHPVLRGRSRGTPEHRTQAVGGGTASTTPTCVLPVVRTAMAAMLQQYQRQARRPAHRDRPSPMHYAPCEARDEASSCFQCTLHRCAPGWRPACHLISSARPWDRHRHRRRSFPALWHPPLQVPLPSPPGGVLAGAPARRKNQTTHNYIGHQRATRAEEAMAAAGGPF